MKKMLRGKPMIHMKDSDSREAAKRNMFTRKSELSDLNLPNSSSPSNAYGVTDTE